MNERIGTLLNRSGGEFYEGFAGSPNTVKFTEEELLTFAELIVRECSGFVYNYPDKYLTRNQAREICLSMEEHFGVKE